jgi:hypothetical protein
MTIIPVFNNISSKFTIQIELDAITFILSFRWNVRGQAWYMNIFDKDNNLLKAGIKLVAKYSLLKQYRAVEGLPPGEFILADAEDDPLSGPMGFENFGTRYQLLYFNRSELV